MLLETTRNSPIRINAIVLLSHFSPFRPVFPHWFIAVFFVLGAIHLFLSLWIVVEYFVINWPHFRLPGFCYTLRYPVNIIIIIIITFVFNRAKLEYAILKESSTYTLPRLTCIDVGLFSVSTLYMFLFLLSSILSLAFSGYFYCFCLLFIIVDNDILKRVLRSVTKNGTIRLHVYMNIYPILYQVFH